MIMSQTPQRSNVIWLQICALMCALVVLPFGTTSAQDYKAVEQRLGEAVAKGELSLEQASVMMDALRKVGGAKKEAVKKKENTNQAEAYLMKVKQELGDAVQAGKISKEDATRKLEIAQKEIKQKVAFGSTKPAAKRITPKDHPRPEAEPKKVVVKGKMSKDDLRARLDTTSKAPKQKKEAVAQKTAAKKISPGDFEQAEAKIRKAIAEGKITKEQGRARLAAMRKMMGDKSESPTEKSIDWEGIKRQIEDAVRNGQITREQADAKYKAIREKLGRNVKEKDAKDKGVD